MYAKIFTQIFDSSIAEHYKVRHVFEDLLKLADSEGRVDMTMEAIQRRTNVPMEEVRAGIEALMGKDAKSRSSSHDGKRLIPIDPRRGWGWIIVNYKAYRSIQDEEARRVYNREAKRRSRDKAKAKSNRSKRPTKKLTKEPTSTDVHAAVRRYENGYEDRDGQPITSPNGSNAMGESVQRL